MERKPHQGRDNRGADRYRDDREGDRFRERRDDREGFQGPRGEVRDAPQGREGHGVREFQEYGDRDLRPSRPPFRDQDPREY